MEKNTRKSLLISVLLICLGLLISCNYKPVHPSLWTIGKNKKEFRKVLDYYSNPEDSLKLRAAEFLIQNMENHFYYQTDSKAKIDSFFRNINVGLNIDSFQNKDLYWWLRDEVMNITVASGLRDGSLAKPRYLRRPDINNIKAEFLIENIEYAFKAWEFPWARDYSFENFCKYILPYRYGNEEPVAWRKLLYEEYVWIKDSIKNSNDPLEAASYLNKQFNYVMSMADMTYRNGIKLNVFNQKDALVYGICNESAGFGVCVLRALGIPSTVVVIPRWSNRPGGHELTGMLDDENNWHYFEFGEDGPEVDRDLRPPKIFLKQFHKMNRFIPVLEDASERLMKVVDLEVKVNAKKDDEIYLCVFGNLKWYPLIEGENLLSKAVFRNVGKAPYLYMAAVKSRDGLKPVSNLFSTDSVGSISYYNPGLEKTESAVFNRKFPYLKDANIHRLKSLIGGKFVVSNDKSFSNQKVVYEIEKMLKYDHNIIKISEQTGKYFRYDFPHEIDSAFDGPAEVSFYTTVNGNREKIEGEYFGSPQLSEEHIRLITDNDVLSYVEVWDCNNIPDLETGKFVLRKNGVTVWLGLKTETAKILTHVGICPRNDKNGIYPGMNYELFYWDDEWISLGKKVATGESIQFDGIPNNAVLWLRNLDEGKEERPFTLSEGKLIWW